jgi:N-acetylneuraminic acid mutarotase
LLVALGVWLTWPPGQDSEDVITYRPVLAEPQVYSPIVRWRALYRMPTPRARLAVTAFQQDIYTIGGESRSGIVGTVDIYSPDLDDWTRGVDLPIPVANVGAVVLGSRIYVPGGNTADGNTSDRLQVYEPGADQSQAGTWTTTAAPLPQALSAYALAAYEDKLYLFGGWEGSSYTAQTYRYDPQADQWTPLAPMPTRRAFGGAGTIGDHIYVVGGYDGQQELDTCEVYDPNQDEWAACPPLRVPRGGIGVAVIADALYVIGGGWQNYLVENEYFSVGDTPTEGTWSTFPSPLLDEWRNLGAAANSTSIYAIGGWDGSDFLGANQTYRTLFRLYVPNMPGPGPGN